VTDRQTDGRAITYSVLLVLLDGPLDALSVAVNAVFTLSRLSFYGQLLQQLNVASLSGPTVLLQCYSLLLLYFGQINNDDDL